MQLQTSMQSILVTIFRIGLLRLSAGTYEATALTAANVVSHLERFWPTFVQFGNVRKAFLPSLRGKRIANILQFLGRRESKLERKKSKKLPKLFHYGFTVKFFQQKVLNAFLSPNPVSTARHKLQLQTEGSFKNMFYNRSCN